MISEETYNSISSLCRRLVDESDNTQVVMGDNYGEEVAGMEAFDSTLFEHQNRGVIQINATRKQVRPPFEWLYEVTLRGEPFKHYLVQSGNTIVEAYGKNIKPVDQTGAQELMQILQDL